jgi:hypothetical protein
MPSIKTVLAVALIALSTAFGGCAAHNQRYSQGLQWHLDNEAQKAQLNAMGFPQYSP